MVESCGTVEVGLLNPTIAAPTVGALSSTEVLPNHCILAPDVSVLHIFICKPI